MILKFFILEVLLAFYRPKRLKSSLFYTILNYIIAIFWDNFL